MATAKELFSKLGNVKIQEGGVYFKPGLYLVEIQETKIIETRKKVDAIVIGCKILGTKNDDEECNQPGTTASQVLMLGGEAADSSLSNWKGFLAKAAGIDDPEEHSDAEWEAVAVAAVEDNVFKGTIMVLNCFEITTKKGHPFTRHDWMRVADYSDFEAFGTVQKQE